MGKWECSPNQLRVRAAKLQLLWVRFLQFQREEVLCEHFDVLCVCEEWRLRVEEQFQMFFLVLKNTAPHSVDYIIHKQTTYSTIMKSEHSYCDLWKTVGEIKELN